MKPSPYLFPRLTPLLRHAPSYPPVIVHTTSTGKPTQIASETDQATGPWWIHIHQNTIPTIQSEPTTASLNRATPSPPPPPEYENKKTGPRKSPLPPPTIAWYDYLTMLITEDTEKTSQDTRLLHLGLREGQSSKSYHSIPST
ncbi:hypothetical protein L804_03360 [Cryptococcus deuterogattii 2001/935-1]|nr:hypothetical protein I352_03135 [Cryptococcus deuterogattii MMRL2647]KIR99727.1 hypothetical protein L804_03360 [Cryptococcus deuterogattii 2001/935-1]